MRNATRQPGAGGIRALGQLTEARARDPRQLAREQAQFGIRRMAQRERAEPDRAPSGRETGGDRPMRRARAAARHVRAQLSGRGAPRGFERGLHDAGEFRSQP